MAPAIFLTSGPFIIMVYLPLINMNAAIVLKNKRNSRFGPALEWAFSKEMDDPKVAQILYFASRRGNNFSVLDLNDILIQYKRYLKIRYGKWRAVVCIF